MIARSTAFCVVIALPLACESPSSPNPPLEEGVVRASIEGHFDMIYEGGGKFVIAGDRHAGTRDAFSLSSRSVAGEETLVFYRSTGGVPSPGVYRFGTRDPRSSDPDPFAALFRWIAGGRIEVFAAFSGEMKVTRSSAQFVEGTFFFEAFQYCGMPAGPDGEGSYDCSTPDVFRPSTPRINVAGTFRAIRETGPIPVS